MSTPFAIGMADFILPSGTVSGAHSNNSKPPTKPNTKTKRSPANPQSNTSVVAVFRRAVESVNGVLQSWHDGMTEDERTEARLRDERRQILCVRLRNAETRSQWEAAAKELDILEGNEDWKQEPLSTDYNEDLIQQRLRALDDARANCDVPGMMHLIRTSLSRDLGGMDNVELYCQSYTGTNQLIERYVDSALKTIDAVVSQGQLDHGIEHRDLLEGLLFARQSFGRSALLLSGGGTFGMCHIGVLKSLFEAQLLPRIISGASAGSIVCAAMCTRTDEEIPLLIKEFPYGDLSVFEEPGNSDGVFSNLRRLLTEGSWSDIKNLSRVMRGLMGDMTFQEAYNRTRRILNICVSTASIYELPRLLNYVTAPNVMIWSAVAASCSVPLVFNASPLLVKDPLTGEHCPWNPTPQRWIDGSVDNDLPMTRLAEMFNVNHFIVSQVNPHVVPFLDRDDHLNPSRKVDRGRPASTDDLDWVYTLSSLAKDEALHRLQFLAEVGFMPNLVTKFRSILSQKYSGDITILPEINMQDLPGLLRNPTSEFLLRACLSGERATWPKLSRIRDRCAIELALDRAVHRLRARVVFSQSQRDLRQLDPTSRSLQLKPPSVPHAGPAMPGVPTGSMNQRRLRRQSGGSLHAAPSRWLLLGSDITDEETEKEERMEMQARRSVGNASMAARKPRLKRASRSQVHMYTRASNADTADTNDLLAEFDFSRPVAPVFSSDKDGMSGPDGQDTNGDESLGSPEIWSDNTGQSRGNATSLTEADGSDGCHSSDYHGDDTDASELGPYDQVLVRPSDSGKSFVPSEAITTGPGGRASWVLWDT